MKPDVTIKPLMRLTFLASTACATAILTSGCASGRFDNLITVSLDGDRAFVSSLYGPVGITAELREADARELKRLRERTRDAEELVRLMSLR